METALLIAQTVALGLITGWLCLGLRDNLVHPSMNETYTAEVLEMTRMRDEYPEHFALVAHRAVTNRQVQRIIFGLVVLLEGLVTLALLAGLAMMALALAGLTSSETARVVAILAAAGFTAVWGGFLVVGNHFCYWLCHEGAQNTHYQMTLWGLGTTILLAI